MSPTIAVPRSYQYFPHFAPSYHPVTAGRRMPVNTGMRTVASVKPAFSGFGSALTPAQLSQQIGQITGQAATGTIAALTLAHVMTAATGALVGTVVGAGIAAITLAVSAILNSGCGQACIITSNWANQAADLLHQNIAAYFGGPRTMSSRAVALANFDNVWNYLRQECGQPGLSTPGVNCIQDRQAGACKWTALAPEFPGEPAVGSCWNWFNAYRDPIANDPDVVPDPVDMSTVPPSSTTGVTSGSNVLLWAGIALLTVGMIGGIR